MHHVVKQLQVICACHDFFKLLYANYFLALHLAAIIVNILIEAVNYNEIIITIQFVIRVCN